MSGNELPLGVRIKQDGAEDTIAKIKQLHDELNRGQITTREYRTEMRDTTTQSRAATQEFNQLKGAMFAANPALLDLTRTMSAFGSVAQTTLSITNAINLAIIATSGTSNQLQDLKVQIANTRLEYEKFANSPQFGPASPQAQAALSKMQELTNQYNNELKQFYGQQIQNGATLISSLIVAGNQAVQLTAFFKTLAESGKLVSAANWLIASSVTGINAAIAASPYILTFLAALQAGGTLANLLTPSSLQSQNSYENYIKNAGMQPKTQPTFIDQFSNFLSNPFGFISNLLLPNASATSTGSYAYQNQDNPSWVRLLEQLSGSSTQSNSNLVTIYTHVDTSNQKLDMTNSILGSISASMTQQATQLQQQTNARDQTINSLQAAIDAALAQKSQLEQKLNQVSQRYAGQTLSTTSYSSDNTSGRMAATTNYTEAGHAIVGTQQEIAATQSKIDALTAQLNQAKQLQEVGTPDMLAQYLVGQGLSPLTGIGSVISSAIGLGGGITSADVNEFIKTHDYGVFTRAAQRDAATQTYTPQDEVSLWINSLAPSMGWTPDYIASHQGYLTSLAKQSLGYTSPSSSSSPTIGTGAFMGAPGQYGNPLSSYTGSTNYQNPNNPSWVALQNAMSANQVVIGGVVYNTGGKSYSDFVTSHASGFEGVTTGPHMFLAGEGGPEYVNIRPMNKSGGGGITILMNNNFEGSLLAERDFYDKIQTTLKDSLRRGGFT